MWQRGCAKIMGEMQWGVVEREWYKCGNDNVM